MEADLVFKLPSEGRLGCLTADQEKVLQDFKAHVTDVMQINDPKWDDWYLLRFCRARKFKLPDVIKMFENFIAWRKEQDVDNAIAKDYSPIVTFAKQYWEHGYYSMSRDG